MYMHETVEEGMEEEDVQASRRVDPSTTMPTSQCTGRRSMLTAVQEAMRAYREGTDEDIRQQEMEANVMEE